MREMKFCEYSPIFLPSMSISTYNDVFDDGVYTNVRVFAYRPILLYFEASLSDVFVSLGPNCKLILFLGHFALRLINLTAQGRERGIV